VAAGRSPGAIQAHYQHHWGTETTLCHWAVGPVEELGPEFGVLEFSPRPDNGMWTYATVGMSQAPEAGRAYGLELHLLAPSQAEAHVELLTMAAYFHVKAEPLGWGHTIEFGRPWCPGSRLGYGLISVPYLDGPKLEWMGAPGESTRFLWLIPITGAERHYLMEEGVEALERRFEEVSVNYLDPNRASVV
jgi:hypothetical protein